MNYQYCAFLSRTQTQNTIVNQGSKNGANLDCNLAKASRADYCRKCSIKHITLECLFKEVTQRTKIYTIDISLIFESYEKIWINSILEKCFKFCTIALYQSNRTFVRPEYSGYCIRQSKILVFLIECLRLNISKK